MKIDIDPSDLGVNYDEDGNASPDFRDAVVRELVRTLTQPHGHFSDLAREVHDEVRKQVTEQVGQIVQDAIEAPVQRTSRWGEPTGDVTTVRELVRLGIEQYLNSPATDRYSSSSKPGNLAELIRQETGRALTHEMADAAKKARDGVKATVVKTAIEAAVKTLSV